MDKETKKYGYYALIILIAIAYMAIENRIAMFLAMIALGVFGLILDSTPTKD